MRYEEPDRMRGKMTKPLKILIDTAAIRIVVNSLKTQESCAF